MGLDITVYKILTEKEIKDSQEYFALSPEEIALFTNHGFGGEIYPKENTYFNFVGYLGEKADEYDIVEVEHAHDGYVTYEEIATGNQIKVALKDIPKIVQTDNVIYLEKVGYQRKGVKPEWYDAYDRGEINDFVFTADTLNVIYEQYCWPEYKEHFKEYVINKFKEGECVVCFS